MVSAQAQHCSTAWHEADTAGILAIAVVAVAARDAPYLTISPWLRAGSAVVQSQKASVGGVHGRSGTAAASAVTRHSAGMLKKLSSIACSAYARFLRLTSPNFLVTGPAALVATARPRSNKTLRDCYMI